MKNKLKPEFDFGNNRNCLDYSVEYDGGELYGSMTPIEGEDDYQENYVDSWWETPYREEEFDKESKKLVKRFLNYDNKKSYEVDSIIYKTKIELYNTETDEFDELDWVLKLTYCP